MFSCSISCGRISRRMKFAEEMESDLVTKLWLTFTVIATYFLQPQNFKALLSSQVSGSLYNLRIAPVVQLGTGKEPLGKLKKFLCIRRGGMHAFMFSYDLFHPACRCDWFFQGVALFIWWHWAFSLLGNHLLQPGTSLSLLAWHIH